MKSTIRWRYLLYSALLVAALVLAVEFRSWLVAYWIQPIALVLWLMVRVVLSLHQSVYWTGLMLLAFLLALRVLPQKPEEYKRYPNAEGQDLVNRVNRFYQLIHSAPRNDEQDRTLKQELRSMIAEMQSIEKSTTREIVTDLSAAPPRSIPVSLSNFLNPGREAGKSQFWALKNWIVGSFIKNKANKYEDAIEEVVRFLETNMEMNTDEQSVDSDDR